MINRLKDHGLFTLLLVVLMAIAIRIPALWIIPQEAVISKPGMLASLVAWINAMPVLSVVVSLLMVVSLAFMINEMVRSHAMMRPVGYLPAYFFILLQSIYLENMLVTEYHFGNFFVFLGLILLLRLRDGYSTVLLFYSALAFGIAILIVPDHLLILLFILSCVLVFKTIVIRDVLAIVFGLILPYYVLRSLIFINGWDVSAVSNITTTPLNIDELSNGILGMLTKYTVYISFLVVALFGLLKVSGNYFSDNVEVRRGKLVVILFFLYIGFIALTSAIQDPRRADRAGALVAIVGAVNVPIIYFSVKWWNTLHQGASVSLTRSPSMAQTMLWGMLLMALACWVYTVAIVLYRTRSLILQRERHADWVAQLPELNPGLRP